MYMPSMYDGWVNERLRAKIKIYLGVDDYFGELNLETWDFVI